MAADLKNVANALTYRQNQLRYAPQLDEPTDEPSFLNKLQATLEGRSPTGKFLEGAFKGVLGNVAALPMLAIETAKDPKGMIKGAVGGVKKVIDNPRLIAEAFKQTINAAQNSPYAAGELIGGFGMPKSISSNQTKSIINTNNLPNKGRELIQSKAEKLAEMLKKQGIEANVTHSGSAMGPSSYVQTNYIRYPARFSGHANGPFNSQFVHDMSDDLDEMQQFVDFAVKSKNSPERLAYYAKIKAANQIIFNKQKELMEKRYAQGQINLAKGEPLSNSQKKAASWLNKLQESTSE